MNKNIIQNWMIKTIEDGSWKTNNDLHIDNISKEFRTSENWLEDGLKCLDMAIAIRDVSAKNFIVELFIELKADNKRIGQNFDSLRQLKNEIAWSPPSLYIFDLNYEIWNKSMKKAKEIKLNDFKKKNIICIYTELFNNDPEYNRSVGFISYPKKNTS